MATKSQLVRESINVPSLTPDEEETLIHARITNDERPLRRLTKKFHTYTSVAYPPIVENPSSTMSSLEEAREAFLIELASFQLMLRKDRMACDAERRQINVYKQESHRIADERIALRNEIEELKLALEQAQLERRRKIEYDQVAEKINTLPTREELELSISALENDIQIIKDEHEAQNRSILARKAALEAIVSDIGNLRVLGKDVPKTDSSTRAPSEQPETEAEHTGSGSGMDVDAVESTVVGGHRDETPAEGSTKGSFTFNPATKSLSPHLPSSLLPLATQNLRAAHSASGLSNSGVTPSASREATPVFTPVGGPDSGSLSPVEPSPPVNEGDNREEGEEEEGEEGEEAEDIEMGEVSEDKGGIRGKKSVEDREEGEASDESSELSEPPDE